MDGFLHTNVKDYMHYSVEFSNALREQCTVVNEQLFYMLQRKQNGIYNLISFIFLELGVKAPQPNRATATTAFGHKFTF